MIAQETLVLAMPLTAQEHSAAHEKVGILDSEPQPETPQQATPELPATIDVAWNKLYDAAQKDTPGTPEFWFHKNVLTSWQLFIRYYEGSNRNGKLIDENMKLNRNIQTLQAEIEKLKNDLIYATEAYVKVRKIQTELEIKLADAEAKPAPGPLLKNSTAASICAFCGEQIQSPGINLYQSTLHTIASFPAGVQRAAICRKCASKAQIELLHPDDPEVIAECQQFEQDCIHDFQARRTRDLDKILQTGTLKILYVSEHEKIIKHYTRTNSTTAEVDEITWGSWKTFEKFDTKKAMLERVKELEQEPDVIFDGRM